MPIPNTDNYYWRYGQRLASQLRGRHLSREEFRIHIVGLTDLKAIEKLSDDPEADRAQQWQDVGKLAVNDKWQQQIYDLQASLKERPSPEQLAEAQRLAAGLQAQVKEATAVSEARAAENAALAEKLEEAKATSGAFTEQDRAVAAETNSLIKVVVEWFKKIFNVGGK